MKKISVLQFICPSRFYGAELWILGLAKYLDSDRVHCQLAITHESDGQNTELYNRFLSLGLVAHQIRMKDRFDPRAIPRLCQLIKRNGIDVIHTHGYKSDILGLIAAKLTGIKAVATPHGFENVRDRKLQLFIRIGCLALRRFDRVAPLSEELESDVRKLKVGSNNTRLIINGVDLDEIDLEKNREIPDLIHQSSKEKTIGYIGQIAYRKNVGDLIRTFDQLFREHRDIRLVLIGDGPEKVALQEMAKSLLSGDRIDFLGYRYDRLSLLKKMDLFSMTSSLEGIPRSIMEAMAMGVPVAAYAIPGVDKLVVHERTGLLAPFGDVGGLKQCWERLLFDVDFSGKIVQNARAHVVEKFSARRMAEDYTRLYEEMIGETVSL